MRKGSFVLTSINMNSKRFAGMVFIAAFMFCSGPAYSLTLTPGSLLGIGGTSHTLYEYDLTGNVTETLHLTDAFSNMVGVVVLGTDVFVMDVVGKTAKIDLLTGNTINSFSAVGNEGLGDDGTNLLVLDFFGGVRRYTSDGSLISTLAVSSGGTGVDGSATDLFVAQYSGVDAGSIRAYDAGGNYLSTINLGLPTFSLSALGFDSTNNTFWVATGFGDHRIRQFDASGNLLANFSAVDTWINGLDVVPGTPVPEPATMLLLGAGLAGLGIMRKRFKV
jgi:hypothetical protein